MGTESLLDPKDLTGEGDASIYFSRYAELPGILCFALRRSVSSPRRTMSLSPEQEDYLELCKACSAGDVERVSQLFASGRLDTEDATDALDRCSYLGDPALIRVLLENGADMSLINIHSVPGSDHVRELLLLLEEYDYDFKSAGHCILQSVLHLTIN